MTQTFEFSHRPTGLPGGDAATDRVVICNGLLIGRVCQIDAGQKGGLWQWSCMWVGTDTTGTADSLAEGLAQIKRRVTPEALKALPRQS